MLDSQWLAVFAIGGWFGVGVLLIIADRLRILVNLNRTIVAYLLEKR